MFPCLVFVLAGVLRYWLIVSDYQHSISNRVEISTPLNSWRRLVEGIYLYDENIDPYQGDMFHESPLMLITFHTITKTVPVLIPFIFTICDLLTAYFLYATTIKFMKIMRENQQSESKEYAKDSLTLLLKDDDFKTAPVYVLAVYLFNPYSILNCVSMTTTVINNTFVSLALFSMICGYRTVCCFAIATAAHQTLYPCLLIVPATIFIENSLKGCAKCSYIRTLTVFVLMWGSLIYLSAYIMNGSYLFLENTYGFMLVSVLYYIYYMCWIIVFNYYRTT